MNEDYIDLKTAAEIMGLRLSRVQKLVRNGTLTCSPFLSRCKRVSKAQCQELAGKYKTYRMKPTSTIEIPL